MTLRRVLIAAVLLALVAAVQGRPDPARAASPCGTAPWCDSSQSPDARADALMAEMTMDEKVSLLGGDDVTGVCACYTDSHTGTSDGVPRLGIPTVHYTDGPVGVRQGKATAMPIPIALAAGFDRSLARSYGALIGNEARDKGNDAVFAPTVNILRTPLWGRAFEGFGEDPFLTAHLTVPWIEGAQGQGVFAVVKHYAANNQEGYAGPPGNDVRPGQPLGPPAIEGNRMLVNVDVDERTLREIYLPAFEAAVKQANVGSVMCSYPRVNGTYACENAHLLQDVLERDWGFKGLVLADYGAAHDPGPSLRNGLDFEPWPGTTYSPTAINTALATGQATPADVDTHVHRILRTMFAAGIFDRAPYRDDDAQIDQKAHAATAQRVEERGATLLVNRGVLPLSKSKPRSIAVIGAAANTFTTGGGSGAVTPFSTVNPLQAITARAGSGTRVSFDDASNPSTAVALARSSDVAIVFASDYETEGSDRNCLTLECPNIHGDQDSLIEQVAAANPHTVVVLETGGAVLTPWRAKVGALLEAWYPGERGGPAIARLLFGDVDPSGRLPETFPNSESDLPTAGDPRRYPGVAENVSYLEGLLVGYRWYDARRIAPAFPFGAGLSYTRFSYRGLRLAPAGGGGATATATVKNTGSRRGIAVPQLYVGLASAPGAPAPVRQLKGFTRVSLRPGRSRRLTFRLDSRAFSYWDTPSGSWRVAPGCDRVWVGGSSRNLPAAASIGRGGASCPRTTVVRRHLIVTVHPRTVRAGRRTRFAFSVRAAGGGRATAAVKGATVRFAGRALRTDRRGHAATTLALPRVGRYSVRAHRAGLGTATTSVRAIRAAAFTG